MIPFLFFLLLATPLIEIAVFIEVGGFLGLWPTLGVVLLTAMLGTALFRIQGVGILRQAQANLEANRFPAHEVFEGLCLLVAGALLITPGFVTDSLGFLLFFPPFRALLRGALLRRLVREGRVGPPPEGPGGEGPVIDGVYREIREEPADEETRGDRPDRGAGG
ncbi:MAG: FxsA family protein [Alphaproteobacteria bacterium]|nr:FxsA family protein [Alphaproteobacteria bacterium]